ncbi:hypothetical protein KIM372_16050 [Bombiscardovia nodaiensis]|uniref:Colicin transporter n=1 Tax=Bombiscardovia nodaiensis TaxID=2932181 RepID=A0ABM8B9X6_9BIFI|nr:hypothetical protein KIM372_16050 [Bombiscardovia nodaiensis]
MGQVETNQAGGQQSAEGHRAGRKRVLVAVAMLVIVALAVVGGGVWWTHDRHERALADCQQKQRAVDKADQSLQASRKKAAAVQDVAEEQVNDAGSVRRLHQLLADGGGDSKRACKADAPTGDLGQTQARLARREAAAKTRAKQLEAAAQAVSRSRDAKVLADAKGALQVKRDEGAKLLADSDGKVADAATRERLQGVLEAAGQVSSGLPADYAKAQANVQAEVDGVNASVQAKAKADADAQAAQQAAAQASRQYAQQPSYQQQGPKASQSAPQQQVPAAPQTSGKGQYGGYDSWEDFLHRPDNTNHGCNADGSCGIG